MSRVGKLPIALPDGVVFEIESDNTVTVKGKKGILVKKMPVEVLVKQEDKLVIVERKDESKRHKQMHGLSRALIFNMVKGVSEGYEKILELNGVGYRAQLKGKNIVMNLGYSHNVEIKEVEGITFEVPNQTQIIVRGIDKQLVGEVAAKIRQWRKPEPYKGKGIKYSDEIIRRKEGKTGKK